MPLFHPGNRWRSPRTQKVYALYELWRTVADFIAAISFLIGSVLFFSESTQYAGTWLFVIGSVFFLLKPTMRLAREIHYLSIGDVGPLVRSSQE